MGFAPSPARLAREAASRLKVAGRVSVASQARRFFKPHERIRFHGVEAPRLRAIAKDLSWQVRGVWTLRDAVECTGRLMRYPVFECRLLGVLLLSRFHGAFEPSLLRDVRSWLLRGYCDNWALTDAISMEIAARVFETFPRHIPVVTQWVRSRSLWLRRAAAVSLVRLARRGTCLDTAYEIATSLLPSHEDLIHKAAGWLLREAGRTDTARLEAFLLKHGPQVPRTAIRYAIERLPSTTRRRILTVTRARPPG